MTYAVKEVYYTLQGEGAHSGRPAVFCRFAGCNLWSGRESDRIAAACSFCDTDFVGTNGPGGGKYATAGSLAQRVADIWDGEAPARRAERLHADLSARHALVVCTGGEPLLQLDEELVDAFHAQGFTVAVETNGTQLPPAGLDWICVSPKAGARLLLQEGDELKLVYPQINAPPDKFEAFEFRHFFLQPMDGPDREANTRAAIAHCLANPRWRLSVQIHKVVGLP